MSAMSADGGAIRVIGPDGFRMIPDTLLLSREVSDADVRLYGLMLWHGRNGMGAFPGRKVLMEEMGKSSLRTIDACLDRLMKAGYLTITPRYDDKGRQISSLYTLHFAPLPEAERQAERPGTATGRRRKNPAEVAASTAPEVIHSPTDGEVPADPSPEETAGQPTVQSTARGTVQSVARGDRAMDCTGDRAADCTGTVQLTAPIRESKVKREEEEDSSTEGDQAQVVGVVENSGRGDHASPRVQAAVYRQLPDRVISKISPSASRRVLAEIATQLQHRSGDELVARLRRNWSAFELEEIRDGVAVARRLLRRGRDCVDVRCEDGVQIDTGKTCEACRSAAPSPGEDVAVPPSGSELAQPPDGETATSVSVPGPRDGHFAARQAALRSTAGDPAANPEVRNLKAAMGWPTAVRTRGRR